MQMFYLRARREESYVVMCWEKLYSEKYELLGACCETNSPQRMWARAGTACGTDLGATILQSYYELSFALFTTKVAKQTQISLKEEY